MVVRRFFLHLFLQFLILLLVWWRDDAPAASPRNACAEPYSNPLFRLESRPVHDEIDVVEGFALASN